MGVQDLTPLIGVVKLKGLLSAWVFMAFIEGSGHSVHGLNRRRWARFREDSCGPFGKLVIELAGGRTSRKRARGPLGF